MGSILVERRAGKLVGTVEYADGGTTGPAEFAGNDEQVHTILVRGGYKRVGKAQTADGGFDPIAGLYVRAGEDE